jgi:hypothetical protein
MWTLRSCPGSSVKSSDSITRLIFFEGKVWLFPVDQCWKSKDQAKKLGVKKSGIQKKPFDQKEIWRWRLAGTGSMNSAFGIKLYCLMWIERYHTTEFRIKTQMPSWFIEASDPSLPIVLTREKTQFVDTDPHSFFTYARSNVWIDNCTRIRIHLQCQKTTGNEPGWLHFFNSENAPKK